MICFDDLVATTNKPRLIPTFKQTERRLLSVFMALLEFSPSIRGAFLERCGYKSGKTCAYQSLMEVSYRGSQYPDVRPDGLIVGERGKSNWSAFIEAKSEKSAIRTEQIQDYISLASKAKVDAIVTISNEFSKVPSELPYFIAASKRKGVDVYHFAWADIRTFLELQKYELDLETSEAAVLEECLRYFWEDGNGIQNYDAMPENWPKFVEAAGTSLGFGTNVKGLSEIIYGWQQERRDLNSKLTHLTRSQMEIRHFAGSRANEDERFKAEKKELAESYRLHAEYFSKETKSSLKVEADLSACRITVALEILPPENKGAKAITTWLLKFMEDWPETDTTLSFDWPGREPDTNFALKDVIEEPSLVYNGRTSPPKSIRILQSKHDVRRFKSRKKFVEELEALALNTATTATHCYWF